MSGPVQLISSANAGFSLSLLYPTENSDPSSVLSPLLKKEDASPFVYYDKNTIAILWNHRHSLIWINTSVSSHDQLANFISTLQPTNSSQRANVANHSPGIARFDVGSPILFVQPFADGEHASGYIKLFVVQENGCLDVWRETEAGFVVEEATRLPISSEKIISCVITDSHIYWAEKDVDERPPNTWALFGLERRKTDRQKNFENPSAFSNTPDTNRLFDTTRVSEPLLLLEESIEELALAQENQIWIFTRDVKNRVRRLFLYSHLKTENLVDYHLPEHSLEEVHSITREVLLLDTNRGKLYAATHTNSNELTHLSNLQTSSHLTGERMHIHQHTLCLLRCSELKLYDLRSGILVQLLNLPQLASTDEFNFCKSLIPSSDCPSGVWCEKGLWQVKQPSVLKYVEFLLNSSTETPNSESTVSPQTSAALLCRDWHLKTEETVCWLKQIDLLYQKKSLNDREFHLLLQACDASFDHLESPAILISVLQKMRAKSHAKAFVERLVRHRSHMLKHLSLTTPPSFPISSLITQYLDTTDEKMISNMPLRWEDRIQQFQTEEKFNQLIKTNLQTWDVFMHRCPNHCLSLLLRLSNIEIDTLDQTAPSTVESPHYETYLIHSVFPIINHLFVCNNLPFLCILMFRLKPRLLLPLLDLLHQSCLHSTDPMVSSFPWYQRALSILQFHLYMTKLSEFVSDCRPQLLVHLGLLSRTDNPHKVLKILIELCKNHHQNFWNWIVDFLAFEQQKPSVRSRHQELVSVLLSSSVTHPPTSMSHQTYIDKTWHLASLHLTSLEFLSVLRAKINSHRLKTRSTCPPQQQQVFTHDASDPITLRRISSQLLHILSRQDDH